MRALLVASRDRSHRTSPRNRPSARPARLGTPSRPKVQHTDLSLTNGPRSRSFMIIVYRACIQLARVTEGGRGDRAAGCGCGGAQRAHSASSLWPLRGCEQGSIVDRGRLRAACISRRAPLLCAARDMRRRSIALQLVSSAPPQPMSRSQPNLTTCLPSHRTRRPPAIDRCRIADCCTSAHTHRRCS